MYVILSSGFLLDFGLTSIVTSQVNFSHFMFNIPNKATIRIFM